MELPDWLEEKRRAARERFAAAPKERLRYGLTIRLDTRGLDLAAHTDTHSEQVVTLEHEDCEVANLFDRLDDPRVREHLLSVPPATETSFNAFTDGHFDIGLLVIVPKGHDARVDLTRTFTSAAFKEHLLIICEEGSSLTVIDKYHAERPATHAQTVEVVAEKDARVRFAAVQHLPEGSYDLTGYRARTGAGARVDWFIASLGASLTHSDVDSRLAGEGSVARSYGVFLGTDEQQFDLSASSFHTGDRSESDMYTRGVLDGKAKAVYRGNIDIAAEAFGCNGYQKEETILLSGDAVADAIPNLEIRNNDVKCSHGATIGRVDEEQLFYLTSRGVPRREAVRMIVEGFFEPLTARLDWPELFELLRPLVHQRVSTQVALAEETR